MIISGQIKAFVPYGLTLTTIAMYDINNGPIYNKMISGELIQLNEVEQTVRNLKSTSILLK